MVYYSIPLVHTSLFSCFKIGDLFHSQMHTPLRIPLKSETVGINHYVKGSMKYFTCDGAIIASNTWVMKIGTLTSMDEVFALKDVGFQLQQHKGTITTSSVGKLSKILIGLGLIMDVASLGHGNPIPKI